MGAALRHVTALLKREPNGVDRYEGPYGVEDSRPAVAEARLQGLHPFCVTADRHALEYMPRFLGAGGHAALRHPEHVPSVLADLLRRLVMA